MSKSISEEIAELGKRAKEEIQSQFRYFVQATGMDGLPYPMDSSPTLDGARELAEDRLQAGCTNITITDSVTGQVIPYP
jgi:hypothetical protein